MSLTDFRLPDVGEGLTEAEVVTWHVGVGDVVEINQVLVDIETAKSVVELPSPAAGTVAALHVEPGTTVEVGTVLVSIAAPGAEVPTAPVGGAEPVAASPEPAEEGGDGAEEKPLVLVGTGPTAPQERRRRLTPRDVARATPPPVRAAAAPRPPAPALAPASLDRSRDVRIPVKGVRKMTAAAMVSSAFTAPHVTEWLTVDVTATMDLLARLKADRRFAGVRLTPLVLVARAFLLAVRQNPAVNARWDEEAQEIVQFGHVNLGIAAATPRGLVVPNIKDAHAHDLVGLAGAMASLVETARSGRTSPQEMAGGTITITNIGALGVDAGTPILNPGEAAILAFGAVREMPWVVEGQIVARRVTQLALSFDHRVVDGELGSKVLADLGRLLQDPGEALLHV